MGHFRFQAAFVPASYFIKKFSHTPLPTEDTSVNILFVHRDYMKGGPEMRIFKANAAVINSVFEDNYAIFRPRILR
jgi:hypothetical protein